MTNQPNNMNGTEMNFNAPVQNAVARNEGGIHNYAATKATDKSFSQEEILQLLAELKASVKASPIDEDNKDSAVGKITDAILEAKKGEISNSKESKEKFGQYLSDTKNILDRVKDVGEIGAKAWPILATVAKMIGLSTIL
jgi:hypothetical protein